jgi:RHS repeat-associated protein
MLNELKRFTASSHNRRQQLRVPKEPRTFRSESVLVVICLQLLVSGRGNLNKITLRFSGRLVAAAALIALFFAFTAAAEGDGSGLVIPSQPGLGVFNEGYLPQADVDPSKGVAHAVVPLTLLPARGAAQPLLRLVYSSDAGTGMAGVGWGFDPPSIERKPLSNPGVNLGDRYTFAGQPIVPICQVQQGCSRSPSEQMPLWAQNWTYYRTQVEGAFARIFRSPNGFTWRVELKSGVTMEFGQPLIAPDAGPSAIDGAIRWNLVRQFDTQGTLNLGGVVGGPVNLVVYRWQQLGELGLGYLSDIYDTPVAGQDLNQIGEYAHHTHLVYEPHDFPTVSHAQVWRASPDQRLKRIDLASKNFAGAGPREPVRRYHLTYKTILHGSYLQSVQLEGRCPAAEPLPDVTNCPTMPPVTFKYAERDDLPDLEVRPVDFIGLPQPETPFNYMPTANMIDIDGDGFPDAVQGFSFNPLGDRSFSFYLNRGSALLPKLSYTTVDANDLFNEMSGLPGGENVFLNARDGLSTVGYWGNVSRSSILWRRLRNPDPHGQDDYVFTYAQSFENPAGQDNWKWVVGDRVKGPKIYLYADIDGDGLQDAVGTDNRVYYTAKDLSPTAQPAFLHPFSSSVAMNSGLVIADPDPNLPPHPSALVDMNGDGLADYVTTINRGAANEQYVYYPGDGTGQFICVRPSTECVQPPGMPKPPAYMPIKTPKAAQDPREALPPYSTINDPSSSSMYFHDINGDGLADIIVVRESTISIWLNDDGINFHRLPDVNLALWLPNCTWFKITFADINASGKDDIVIFCAAPNAPGGLSYIDLGRILDLANPIRQGLLVEISNGLGVTTKIRYESTADLDTRARHEPDLWDGNQPHPWHDHSRKVEYVVTSLETNTNLPATNLNQAFLLDQHSLVNFRYRDAIFDEWQQAFLGFRKVRAQHVGDQHDVGMVTDTTYFFGPCQGPRNNSSCLATSNDDDWKAVTGVPVLSERYDGSGLNRLSTTVWEYRSQVLFNGMGDTRRVRFAYPERTDTWLYDESTGNFGSSAEILTVPVIDRQFPGGGQMDQIQITLASTPGRVHLRAEETRDSWGNVTQTVDRGQINDDGTPIDLPVITDIKPVTAAPFWRWSAGSVTVQPFPHQQLVPDGEPRAVQFQYDFNGNLTDVFANLIGGLPLDRFHENPTKAVAPAPLNASVDNPKLQLRHWIYDQWGNVTQIEGPQNGGTCRSFTYETTYRQLATDSAVFTAGCSNHQGQGLRVGTHWDYDRGLDAVISSIAPTGAQSKSSYDAFGRIAEIYEPDPATGGVSNQPSVKAEYIITADGPTQLVHTQAIDGNDAYRSVWTYLNGFGTPILALREADPGAGDEGQWVASGLPFRSYMGSVYQTFQPGFYSGDPKQYPVGGDPTGAAMYEFQYDFHGRILRVNDATGLILQFSYHALSQDNFDAADLEVNGSHSNTPSSIQQDGHGRTVSSTFQLKTPNGLDKITTQRIYLSTGEVAGQLLTHSLGNEQVLRWLQYDSQGRLVLNAEPNTSYTQVIPPPFCNPFDPPSCVPEIKLRAWRYAYDDAGHVVGTSDARGCGKNVFYDRAGRLVAEDFSPCRSYHPDYTQPNLTDGSGTETFFLYDVPEPGEPPQDFGPNPAFLMGNVAATSDLGAHTRFAWDARGRTVGIARQLAKPGIADPSLLARYAPWWFRSATAYDVANRVADHSTGADVQELMTRGSKGGIFSDITPHYSGRGVLTKVDGSYGDLVTALRYDADGALRHQVYGDVAATATDFNYDDRRNVKEFKVSRVTPGLWSNPTGGYLPPTGTKPSTLQLTLEDLVFGYDAANNPTGISDKRNQSEWPEGTKPISRTMTYDDLYRLTRIIYDSTGDKQISPFAAENSNGDTSPVPAQNLASRVQQQDFSYDFLSNTTQTSDDAHAFYDRSLGAITNGTSQQSPNQILSALSASGETLTAHYDSSGDLEDLVIVRKGPCASPGGKCTQRFVYDWDEVGRLSRVRRWDYTVLPPNEPVYPSLPNQMPAADLQYKYDAIGLRVLKSKTDGSGNQLHSAEIFGTLRLNHAKWDPTTGNYERTPLTETVYLGGAARVVYTQQPLPTVNNLQQHVLFLIGDPSGSMSVAVDKTTGEVIERTTYDAFGNPDSDYRPPRWSSFREDYRFTGKEDDIEVGLTYFGARYYQSALGRWISPDPLAVHGGGADFNPYAFESASPLKYADPSGLQPCIGPEDCGPIGFQFGGPGGGGGGGGGGSGGGGRGGGGGPKPPSPYYPPPPPPPPAAATGVLGSSGSYTEAYDTRDFTPSPGPNPLDLMQIQQHGLRDWVRPRTTPVPDPPQAQIQLWLSKNYPTTFAPTTYYSRLGYQLFPRLHLTGAFGLVGIEYEGRILAPVGWERGRYTIFGYSQNEGSYYGQLAELGLRVGPVTIAAGGEGGVAYSSAKGLHGYLEPFGSVSLGNSFGVGMFWPLQSDPKGAPILLPGIFTSSQGAFSPYVFDKFGDFTVGAGLDFRYQSNFELE